MSIRFHRRLWLKLAMQGSVAACIGCGTILHPERRNQPHGGRIDWGVVALDALGLLFFFIPGVIAFAVDFSTGAIYFPPECPPGVPLTQGPLERVETVPQPSMADVERVVSQRAERPIKLAPGGFLTEPLSDLRDFWAAHKRLA